ncbi:uncharacterized protein LOC135823698 [Sycon ciliatum]|uniref:uncharacterized protein LOC135813042 n=1 Tax=Sycon ciliatum TaxID=27933 RepID=UPI0031F60116
MPSSCAADSCANRASADCPYRFFRFPKSDRERCQMWIASVCHRRPVGWWPSDGMRICGKHFLTEEPSDSPHDVDYIPTIVDSKPKTEERAVQADARKKRQFRREQRKGDQPDEAAAAFAAQPEELPQSEPVSADKGPVIHAPLPETTDGLAARIRHLEFRVHQLETHACEVTSELDTYRAAASRKQSISAHDLEGKDKLVRFNTGFPSYAAFISFFHYLSGKAGRLHIWRGQKEEALRSATGVTGRLTMQYASRQLELVDEFLAVMMRLRLGLLVEDVCFRFGISATYFSKIFTTWIVFLSKELALLFPWPSAEQVRFHTPPQFAKYPNTRVIIDCFELFIERPSALRVNCQMFSHYKNHSTFKALIGISPGGVVTYLSKLFTGRASDKFIVSHSGFLDLIEHGDNVMADKGFEIRDLLLPKRATLNIPPFLGQQRSQFTAQEVDDTRRIAALRIHVERAIARLRCFRILRGTLPITLAPIANDIVTVCTLVTNFSDPLVADEH